MRCDPVELELMGPNTSELACMFCGCTDDHACVGGCRWISHDPPVCSACEAAIDGGAVLPAATFNRQRCHASPTPAMHTPIFVDQVSGRCARCKIGFVL